MPQPKIPKIILICLQRCFINNCQKSPKSLIFYTWSFVNVFISYIDHLSMFNWKTSLINIRQKTETSKKKPQGPLLGVFLAPSIASVFAHAIVFVEASLFVPLLYHHCQQRYFVRSTFCVKHTTPFSSPVNSMLIRASPATTRWKSSFYATPYKNLGQYLCLVLFVFIEYFWLKMCVTSGIRVFAKWTSRPREHSVTCPSGDQHQHHQHQQRQRQKININLSKSASPS